MRSPSFSHIPFLPKQWAQPTPVPETVSESGCYGNGVPRRPPKKSLCSASLHRELYPLKREIGMKEEGPICSDLEGDASPTSFAPQPWFREEDLSGTLTVVRDKERKVPTF